MKKQYMLIIALATSMITARAQSSYTTIQYNKNMQPALVLELPYTTNDVEGTILEKLKQIGYNPETQGHLFWKKNKTDGFYVFNNVVLPSLSTQKLDMYFKVVKKNNEEKNNSTLYLLVSTGNENFASPAGDTTLWNSSKMFLNGFIEKTVAYNLEQNITAQENTVKASQKKLATLQKDEKDLSEKIKRYQNDLGNNQNNQKDQQQDIENQQKLLESLIVKRKG
jgi:hypothetical protein